MKLRTKLLLAILSVMMLLTMFVLAGCKPDTPNADNTVQPPEPTYKVHSVTMKYDGDNIEGTLAVDIVNKEIQITTEVRKDAQADGTVKYSSNNKDVATIDANGKIILVGEGETVIRAEAGGKTHSIVLIVKDDFTEKKTYTITVNGGTASVTSAAPGEYVTLTALIPEHKDFTRWNYSVRGVLTSGNLFKMPAEDIVITAEYTDKLYTLNLIGVASVFTTEGEELVGEIVGNTKDGSLTQYDIVAYGIKYGTELTVEALDDPSGMIFVGWDAGAVNNRVGEMGVPEYSFTMPGETYTIWANYSTLHTQVLTSNPTRYWDTSRGSKVISGGVPNGEAEDPDLEGLSGYRLTFTAGETALGAGDYPENIQGSTLDTISEGTNAMKAIFKNRGNYDVTLELYVTFYGNIVTSGHVTVPANSTVTKFFPAGLGIWNPWMGIALRENIEGSGGTFNVDVVLGRAPMYPEGDPLLRPNGKADLVELDTSFDQKYNGWSRELHYNAKYGLVTYSIYGKQFADANVGENNPAARTVKITNMPEYDPDNPYTTIYARVINNATSGDFLSQFDVCVGTDADPRKGTNTVCETVVHEKIGDVVVIAIKVPRTANDGQFYLSVLKKTVEGSGTYYPHNFSMVLAYNNVFGYEEEN